MVETDRQIFIDPQESARMQAAWDGIAEAYDQITTPNNLPLADNVFCVVELRADMRFLDVACGTGALSLPAARLAAQVVAVDYAPKMIERLRARARAEGLSNIQGLVMDGHALELEDGSFDVSGSQFGVMLFPDLPRALAELVRVTKVGGQVFLVAFGPPAKAEFLSLFLDAVRAVVPDFKGLPLDPPPLPFQVADPRVLHERLVEAGLKNVQVKPGNHRMEFRSGRHWWDLMTSSNPLGAGMVSGLTGAQRAEIERVLDVTLQQRAASGPATINNQVNIGVGTK